MSNKGFVKFLAISLTLVSLFYLSFTAVTNSYYQKASVYGEGDPHKEAYYLDSLAHEVVWRIVPKSWENAPLIGRFANSGYTLQECRNMEITLGLDLKGGMNVIMEISGADVLYALSDYNPDPIFNQALAQATDIQNRGGAQGDYVSIFLNQYTTLDPNARLAAIFGTYDLREKITAQSSNADVANVLRAEMKSAFDNSFNVLRTRIDRFGVVAPNIQQLDRDGRISIELPGVKEPERVRALLSGTANLEFWETYLESEIHETLFTANTIIRDSINAAKSSVDATAPAAANAATTEANETATGVEDLLGEIQDATPAEETENLSGIDAKMYPLFSILEVNPFQPAGTPVVATVRKSEIAKVDAYLNNTKVKELFATNRLSLKWTNKAVDAKDMYYQLVALKVNYVDGREKPILDGDVITDARDDFDSTGSYVVSMTMNSEGAKTWARMTRENIGRSIAIVLDNNVYSFPNVNDEITGGRSQISGNFTPEEAKDLANVLKTGRMSAPAKIIQEDVVGPSLGQEAIQKGFISFIIALIILMIYLVAMYGFTEGMVANCALLINLFFTMGVMASFHVVLTLSGIAGIVLALAIAVDANVLIYERIKEELRGGRTVAKALEEGYGKAFSAIFDANITSLLTGIILLIFGTGPIRGFAFTLIIGICVSFFTAVFLTRTFYTSRIEKGKFRNLTFTTAVSKNLLVDPKFDFLKKRTVIYIVVAAAVAIAIGAFGLRGLNQGIDFTGGRNYIVHFDQDINTVEAQELLDPYFEDHTPSVITIGTANQVRISTNYKIESNDISVDDEIKHKIYDALNKYLPAGTTYEEFVNVDNGYIPSTQQVGPSIADDMKKGAIWAVVFAVLGIGLYILMRFRDISYSVGTIVALMFDAVLIIGTYALLWGFVPFSLEIDQTFIGAILTAIGYSVNDKVVIFDRVREYHKLYPKRDGYELFNASLNSTLNRTFNTSFSTLLVLIIIFIFAGETLRSFSFAMILGIVYGTISSLFIGAPLAFDMQKRSKKNKA